MHRIDGICFGGELHRHMQWQVRTVPLVTVTAYFLSYCCFCCL
jgi:hypothetical protein